MKKLNGQRPLEAKRWPIAVMIFVVLLVCGCVRTVPSLPEHKEANTMQLGVLGLRSVDAPPAVLYQRPPKGVVDGLLRGTRHGAVVGAHVGWGLAKWFTLAGPKTSEECVRTTNEGAKCHYFTLMAPVIGLFTLIAIPPAVTTAAGIQAGFTAYSSAEVEKWEKTLADAQDALQIQTTLRESVRHSLSSCCRKYLPPTQGEVSASPHSSNGTDFSGVDTVLETDVLELGLAEAISEELAAPDESMQAVKPDLAKAVAPLNAIFQRSRSSLYMLVQTKLLRIKDNSLLDERKFGYLSTPRPYMEWTEGNAVQFRAELLAAYEKLADQIVEKVVRSALPPNRETQTN
jgi:hypothetical protein